MSDYRKLYDKISVSRETITALNTIQKKLTEADPRHRKTSYNKAILHLLDNQRNEHDQ